MSRTEVKYLKENVRVVNRKCLIVPKAKVVIQKDASLKGWWAKCMDVETEGKWSLSKKLLQINSLECQAFTKNKLWDCIQ